MYPSLMPERGAWREACKHVLNTHTHTHTRTHTHTHTHMGGAYLLPHEHEAELPLEAGAVLVVHVGEGAEIEVGVVERHVNVQLLRCGQVCGRVELPGAAPAGVVRNLHERLHRSAQEREHNKRGAHVLESGVTHNPRSRR